MDKARRGGESGGDASLCRRIARYVHTKIKFARLAQKQRRARVRGGDTRGSGAPPLQQIVRTAAGACCEKSGLADARVGIGAAALWR